MNDTISDMQAASTPHMWFPVACFAFGGVATFCFAVFGLRPALAAAGKLNARAPWMLAVSTLALGNSFPLVPCSAPRRRGAPSNAKWTAPAGSPMPSSQVSPFRYWPLLPNLFGNG